MHVWQDLKFAARLLARERAFTVTAVLALALGIGVNNTLFTIVDAICIRGLPLDHPDRVVDVSERDQTHPFLLLSPRQFDALDASRPPTLNSVAAYTSRPSTLRDDRIAAETVIVAYVSAGAFATIGAAPLLGRGIHKEDAQAGSPPVAVLGAGIWRTRYGSDPAIVGRTVRVGGVPVSVIGVMPDGFKFPDNADVWRPLAALNAPPDVRLLRVYGRLADDATVSQAAASIAPLIAVPINTRFNGDITNPAWIAFITVGVLLVIIACSNVANLLLARGVGRGREMAVRLSLGATRWQIVRQLLLESAILAALGGVAAVGVSEIGLDLLSAALPPGSLPYWIHFTMDGRVAAMLAAVVLGTVLLFGLAPALHLSRTSPNAMIKQTSGALTPDRGSRRWTWVFLTAQLALTVVLLAKLTITVQEYYFLQTREVAIDARHILTFGVNLPSAAYRTGDQRRAFLDRLTQRLEHDRGAKAVSVTGTLPSRPGPLRRVVPASQTIAKTTPPLQTIAIDAAFFPALGVNLIEGRGFTRGDPNDERSSIIVNQRFAQIFFPGVDPIGQRVRIEAAPGARTGEEVRTIVGVAPSFRQQPAILPDPQVYIPITADAMTAPFVMIRVAGDAASFAPSIRDELRGLDPEIAANRLMTLEDARWEARWNARVATEILTTVALIALGLAAIGLAALTAYTVAQRRRELGIRLALGATRAHLIWLMLRRVLTQVLVGLMAGWAASIGWSRIFDSAGGNGPANILVVGLAMAIVALGVTAFPAARAGRIDPLIALKDQ